MKKITMIQPDEIRPWESGEIDRIACLVNADPGKKEFVLVENSDDADIIVLLESCTLKSNQNINDYKKLMALQQNLWVNFGSGRSPSV